MAMVVVDDSCLKQADSAQVRWLGLRVRGCLPLFYIHQMNEVNSHNHDNRTINIAMGIIIIINMSIQRHVFSGDLG